MNATGQSASVIPDYFFNLLFSIFPCARELGFLFCRFLDFWFSWFRFWYFLCDKDGKRWLENLLTRILFGPITPWWNRNLLASAQLCYCAIGDAVLFGKMLHRFRPHQFIELFSAQRQMCRGILHGKTKKLQDSASIM